MKYCTGITYPRIFSDSRMLRLDDGLAMALLNPANTELYLNNEHYVGVFMSVLCFPLLVPFGKTTNI